MLIMHQFQHRPVSKRLPDLRVHRLHPKPGWRSIRIAGRLAEALDVPVAFDTDVNGAALAEGRWGAGRNLEDFAYITVGTGVGVGLVANGRLVHGFAHPELGHIRIARKPGDDWRGICAFHGDCVEGLASGQAIAARAGMPAHQIPVDHPTWEFAAHALSQLLHTLVLATAPRRILVGGGVVEARPVLLEHLRRGGEPATREDRHSVPSRPSSRRAPL